MKFDSEYFKGKTSNYSFGGYDSLLMRLGLKFRNRNFINTIKKYKSSGKLIDLGCVYGYFVNLASKSGFDSCGCDISKFTVKEAKKRFPHLSIFNMNIENKIKPTKNFDIVTAFDVLEHCKNYVQF